MMTHPRRRLIQALPLLTFLQGCSAYHWVVPRTVRVKWIAFKVEAGANDDIPIAIDIAYLSADPILVDEVAKMTAAQWFDKKDQLRRDFPNAVDAVSWELVPGSVLPRTRVPEPKVDHAAFLFARYREPQPFRFKLTEDDEDIRVVLGLHDVTLVPR
jgi:type VI secretion system protein